MSARRKEKLLRRALKRDKKRRAENAQQILDAFRQLIEACEAEGVAPEGVLGFDLDREVLAAHQAGNAGLLKRLMRERCRAAGRREAEAAAAMLPKPETFADVITNTLVFSTARDRGISIEEATDLLVKAGYLE